MTAFVAGAGSHHAGSPLSGLRVQETAKYITGPGWAGIWCKIYPLFLMLMLRSRDFSAQLLFYVWLLRRRRVGHAVTTTQRVVTTFFQQLDTTNKDAEGVVVSRRERSLAGAGCYHILTSVLTCHAPLDPSVERRGAPASVCHSQSPLPRSVRTTRNIRREGQVHCVPLS